MDAEKLLAFGLGFAVGYWALAHYMKTQQVM